MVIAKIKQLTFILIIPLFIAGLGLLIKSNQIALSKQNKYRFLEKSKISFPHPRRTSNKEITEKLEPDLARIIKQGRKNPLRVALHLKVENVPDPFVGNSPEERREHLRNRRTYYAKIQQPLVDELKVKKQQVIYQSEYSAVVFALVTPKIIQEMALRKDVERVYLEYGYNNSSKPPQQNQNISRPAYVMQVFPSENSIQSSINSISADLNFAQEQIQVELSSIQLILNGVDVTSQTRIAGTRNYPPSSLTMEHVIPHLKSGKYSAEILFRTKNGKSQSYKWSFTLR